MQNNRQIIKARLSSENEVKLVDLEDKNLALEKLLDSLDHLLTSDSFKVPVYLAVDKDIPVIQLPTTDKYSIPIAAYAHIYEENPKPIWGYKTVEKPKPSEQKQETKETKTHEISNSLQGTPQTNQPDIPVDQEEYRKQFKQVLDGLYAWGSEVVNLESKETRLPLNTLDNLITFPDKFFTKEYSGEQKPEFFIDYKCNLEKIWYVITQTQNRSEKEKMSQLQFVCDQLGHCNSGGSSGISEAAYYLTKPDTFEAALAEKRKQIMDDYAKLHFNLNAQKVDHDVIYVFINEGDEKHIALALYNYAQDPFLYNQGNKEGITWGPIIDPGKTYDRFGNVTLTLVTFNVITRFHTYFESSFPPRVVLDVAYRHFTHEYDTQKKQLHINEDKEGWISFAEEFYINEAKSSAIDDKKVYENAREKMANVNKFMAKITALAEEMGCEWADFIEKRSEPSYMIRFQPHLFKERFLQACHRNGRFFKADQWKSKSLGNGYTIHWFSNQFAWFETPDKQVLDWKNVPAEVTPLSLFSDFIPVLCDVGTCALRDYMGDFRKLIYAINSPHLDITTKIDSDITTMIDSFKMFLKYKDESDVMKFLESETLKMDLNKWIDILSHLSFSIRNGADLLKVLSKFENESVAFLAEKIICAKGLRAIITYYNDSFFEDIAPLDQGKKEILFKLCDGDPQFLIDAVAHGRTASFTHLIKWVRLPPKDIIVGDRNETLAHIAAYHGYTDLIAVLAKQGVDLDQADKNGYSPLHRVIVDGQRSNSVKALLECKANINQPMKDIWGLSPIQFAAYINNVEIFQLLAAHYTDLDQITDQKSGNSLAHYAVMGDSLPILRELITNNVDVTLKNKAGNSPLASAVFNEQWQLVKKLVEQNPSWNSYVYLNVGFYVIQPALIDQLFEWKKDPNELDSTGNTLAHVFVSIFSQNCKSASPAFFDYSTTLLEKLRKYQIDFHKPNREGQTAIQLATAEKRWDLVNVMLKGKTNTFNHADVKGDFTERKSMETQSFVVKTPDVPVVVYFELEHVIFSEFADEFLVNKMIEKGLMKLNEDTGNTFMREEKSLSVEEQYELIRGIKPRGEKAEWQKLFKTLLDEGYKIAILSFSNFSNFVVRHYFKEILGLDDIILAQIFFALKPLKSNGPIYQGTMASRRDSDINNALVHFNIPPSNAIVVAIEADAETLAVIGKKHKWKSLHKVLALTEEKDRDPDSPNECPAFVTSPHIKELHQLIPQIKEEICSQKSLGSVASSPFVLMPSPTRQGEPENKTDEIKITPNSRHS